MEEYATWMNERAEWFLRAWYKVPLPSGESPIIQLINTLISDDSGGIRINDSLVESDDWQTWHMLIRERREELTQTIAKILENDLDEEWRLPSEHEAMQHWAEGFLLETLYRMDLGWP